MSHLTSSESQAMSDAQADDFQTAPARNDGDPLNQSSSSAPHSAPAHLTAFSGVQIYLGRDASAMRKGAISAIS